MWPAAAPRVAQGGEAAGKGRAASGKKEESDGGGSDSDGDDEGLDDDAMLRMARLRRRPAPEYTQYLGPRRPASPSPC